MCVCERERERERETFVHILIIFKRTIVTLLFPNISVILEYYRLNFLRFIFKESLECSLLHVIDD